MKNFQSIIPGRCFPGKSRRMRLNHEQSERGFSLLELLVALSITAMVVAAVSVSFSSWMRVEESSSLAIQKMRSLELANSRLRDTISTSYISMAPNRPELSVFNGMELERPNEPFDALTYTSISHRTHRVDAKQSDLAEMTVFTEPDESLENGDQCRILKLREGGSINDRFEVEGGLVYDLAYHISRFQLFYLNPEGDLKQEWKLSDAGSLPCAVVAWLGSGCAGDEEDECLFIPLTLNNAEKCEFEQEQLRNVCAVNK